MNVAKQWASLTKDELTSRSARVVMEWRQQEARETLQEIARQEGLDWLLREVLAMARTG